MKIPFLPLTESMRLNESKSELDRLEDFVVKLQASSRLDKMAGDDIMQYAKRIYDDAWRKGAKEGFHK